MRIAIPSTSNDMNSLASPVFGRSPGFLIIEIKDNKIVNHEFIENPGARAWRGAGVASAQTLINANVDVVITSSIGPNSFDILRSANIRIYQGSGTIEELVNRFLSGSLPEIKIPTGRGFGFGRGWGRRWR